MITLIHVAECQKLKLLDLSRCMCLTVTPDLSGITSLERLILHGCENLVDLHSSVGQLRNLISLNLEFCKKLRRLPEDMSGLVNLRDLLMNNSGIGQLHVLPASGASQIISHDHCHISSFGCLISLSELDLSDTPITEVCASIRGLRRLEIFNLRRSTLLTKLPDEIGELILLVVLDISGTSIKEIPNSVGNLKNLKRLH